MKISFFCSLRFSFLFLFCLVFSFFFYKCTRKTGLEQNWHGKKRFHDQENEKVNWGARTYFRCYLLKCISNDLFFSVPFQLDRLLSSMWSYRSQIRKHKTEYSQLNCISFTNKKNITKFPKSVHFFVSFFFLVVGKQVHFFSLISLDSTTCKSFRKAE